MDSDLQHAISLIKAGKKVEGGQLLTDIVKKDPQNIQAWLWLSSCVNTNEQKIICLKKVLGIDPNHQIAHNALSKLLQFEEPSENEILGNNGQNIGRLNKTQADRESFITRNKVKDAPSQSKPFSIKGTGEYILVALIIVFAIIIVIALLNKPTISNPQLAYPQIQSTLKPFPTSKPLPTNTHIPTSTPQPALLPGPARRYVPVTNEGMPSNYRGGNIDEYRLEDGSYYQIDFSSDEIIMEFHNQTNYFFSAFVGDTEENAQKKYQEASESFQVDDASWKYTWTNNTYVSKLFDKSGQYICDKNWNIREVGRVFRINNVVVVISVYLLSTNQITMSDTNIIQTDLDKYTAIVLQKFQ